MPPFQEYGCLIADRLGPAIAGSWSPQIRLLFYEAQLYGPKLLLKSHLTAACSSLVLNIATLDSYISDSSNENQLKARRLKHCLNFADRLQT